MKDMWHLERMDRMNDGQMDVWCVKNRTSSVELNRRLRVEMLCGVVDCSGLDFGHLKRKGKDDWVSTCPLGGGRAKEQRQGQDDMW